MEDKTSLNRLNNKITQILQKYDSLKAENEKLRMELVTLRAEKEVKDQEIERLLEQNVVKDLEIEEIVNKIETMLG